MRKAENSVETNSNYRKGVTEINRNPFCFLARPLGIEWFGTPLLDTHYGPWGKDNVVCSEADWALVNAAGRNIPKSGDRIKTGAGVDFSPADFQNSQYFLVTPLW